MARRPNHTAQKIPFSKIMDKPDASVTPICDGRIDPLSSGYARARFNLRPILHAHLATAVLEERNRRIIAASGRRPALQGKPPESPTSN
jgi:hypothetical protein